MRNEIPSATEIIAGNLDRLMAERGLVDRVVGKLSGVGHKTVNNMRQGRHGATLEKIEAVARALKVPAWMLLVPNAPIEMLRDGEVQRLVRDFLDCNPEQQKSLSNLAASAAEIAKQKQAI
jgi:transcriptional regulator with XRE-family HTH domain